MKPVISANMRAVQAALRASSTWPSRSAHSITAASTGVGLFQCVQSQAGQRSRCFGAAVLVARSISCQRRGAGGQKLWPRRCAHAGNTPVDR